MKIYHDPLQKDAFLVEANGIWFSISEGGLRRTEFKPENLPPMELAQLVPIWLVDSILQLRDFFSDGHQCDCCKVDGLDPGY